MIRNDLHTYSDNVTIRIIKDRVLISKENSILATDIFVGNNPKSQKTSDLYYKKHILGTYDDLNEIKTPYICYNTEYSPEPGVMLRVLTSDFGIKGLRKIVSTQGKPQKMWAKRGEKVTDVIKQYYSERKKG